jgi:hypothetical protein
MGDAMTLNRRNALLTTLFGAGYIGLRALATGLPASLLLAPRRALAAPPSNPLARFIVFQTSGNGDPINASCPGTYDDVNGSAMTAGIAHSADPSMAKTPLLLGGAMFNAALPWAQPWLAAPTVITPALWQTVLDRTTFFHIATSTPIHPKEPNVLKLMDQTQSDEMLLSILARQLAPQLGTIQAQPIALGASSPSEALTFGGQTQPLIPPTALKATLANPAGPLSSLQALRDQTMSALYDVYRSGATPAQQAYIDSLVTSQRQARDISQTLLGMLDSISDNSVASQITAALALVQMKVTPVLSIHVPFGGDNHVDPGLATESQQTAGVSATGAFVPGLTGVPGIAALMSAIYAANLQDQVAFMSLNVFGRTLATATGAGTGRQHNPNHHVAIAIGSGFKPGVVGGVAPLAGSSGEYGAVAIDSATGVGSAGGDIAPAASLASWGKTMMAGVGIDPGTIAQQVLTGTVIAGALTG